MPDGSRRRHTRQETAGILRARQTVTLLLRKMRAQARVEGLNPDLWADDDYTIVDPDINKRPGRMAGPSPTWFTTTAIFAWRESHDGRDLWVVRKGATSAFPGQRGFVCGSMGDDAVILEGVDSPEARASLYSTVHGVGRVFGRKEAKRVSRTRRWNPGSRRAASPWWAPTSTKARWLTAGCRRCWRITPAFREDASRIRCNPGIFARLRSFAYNILRFNQSDTIAQDRYAAALGGLEALSDMNYYKER